MRIPLWHKVVLFAVFIAAVGAWAWLANRFVKDWAPEWLSDVVFFTLMIFAAVVLVPGWLAWWRQKFRRSGLPRRTD